jgi:hypothetical protein
VHVDEHAYEHEHEHVYEHAHVYDHGHEHVGPTAAHIALRAR